MLWTATDSRTEEVVWESIELNDEICSEVGLAAAVAPAEPATDTQDDVQKAEDAATPVVPTVAVALAHIFTSS
ncbi:hypothetical protein GCM10009765_21930 [Fodinicola feengrottensis]|uniref:Uncharacterized protein n=1 Tax=Fodinicola feengrottensis TaxID=435914 RepID=A0ABN2GJ83_9ACTN